MIITHNVKEKISKDVNKDNISLFLMSKRGNYFSLSADPSKNISNFNGWFNFLGNEKYSLYKSIENIYHEKMRDLATIDNLTGAYNKKFVTDYVASEFNRCRSLGMPLSIILFDLDHFKKVNPKLIANIFFLEEVYSFKVVEKPENTFAFFLKK